MVTLTPVPPGANAKAVLRQLDAGPAHDWAAKALMAADPALRPILPHLVNGDAAEAVRQVRDVVGKQREGEG